MVCSNETKCDKENQNFFRFMIGLKPKACFCSGKFGHDCENKFCAINKATCEFLFNKNKNSLLKSKKIKFCA